MSVGWWILTADPRWIEIHHLGYRPALRRGWRLAGGGTTESAEFSVRLRQLRIRQSVCKE